jgi:hypothetical protein
MAKINSTAAAVAMNEKRWGKRKEAEAEARSRRLSGLADKVELETSRMRAETINREATLLLVRNLAQSERDAILSWPARAAPLLAADLGVDEHALHAALDASLRAHLTDRAEQTLEL